MPVNSSELSEQAHIVEALKMNSENLIREMGFAPNTEMTLSELKTAIAEHETRIVSGIRAAYEPYDIAGSRDLGSDPDVQLAYAMNIQKMTQKERVRKNGLPYYTHPQSVSQRFVSLKPESASTRKMGVMGALLHDYLEEGDGVSRKSLKDLREAFGSMGTEFVEQLVLLTEPNYIEKGVKSNPDSSDAINYDELKDGKGEYKKDKIGHGRKVLETVIFGMILERSPLMQLVVPVDKLDNVGDCDLIQRKKIAKEIPPTDPAYHDRLVENVAKSIGTFAFYAENCTSSEAQESRRALEDAVNEKINSLSEELPELRGKVAETLARFKEIQNNPEHRKTLLNEVKKYYKGLGLSTVVEKLEDEKEES